MLGVTLFGLFLTPVFYVGLRKLSGRKLIQHGGASLAHGVADSGASEVVDRESLPLLLTQGFDNDGHRRDELRLA